MARTTRQEYEFAYRTIRNTYGNQAVFRAFIDYGAPATIWQNAWNSYENRWKKIGFLYQNRIRHMMLTKQMKARGGYVRQSFNSDTKEVA